MRKFIIWAALFIMLLGCLGQESGGEIQIEKEEGQNVSEEVQEDIKVNITVEEQKNETAQPPPQAEPPVEEEETEEAPEYIFNPQATTGVYFLDVADRETHGRAVLVKKGDFDMIIDTGPEKFSNKLISFLRSKNVDDIEVLVLSVNDPRVLGGVEKLKEKYAIREVWWNGDEEMREMVESIEAESRVVGRGEEYEYNGIKFEILNPPSKRFADPDNNAVVIRMVDKNVSILFTSNILMGAQGDLANTQNISAHILHAPYFGVGRGTRNIQLFLQKVSPEVTIIDGSERDTPDMGAERAPFKRLLNQYNIGYVETYETGDAKIIIDEQGYSVQ